MSSAPAPMDPADPTSQCIAGAVAGDRLARDRLVERFSPVLLVHARFRMQGLVRGCEPEDIVQEVWAIALPKLRDLRVRDGRWTPVVLKFLAVILLRTVNAVVRRNLRRRGGDVGVGDVEMPNDPLQQAPLEVSGIVTRLARAERSCAVRQAMQQLSPEEQEVLVLRGIEQLQNRDVAHLLGIDDSVVTRRYQRALQHLKDTLPDSVLAELE